MNYFCCLRVPVSQCINDLLKDDLALVPVVSTWVHGVPVELELHSLSGQVGKNPIVVDDTGDVSVGGLGRPRSAWVSFKKGRIRRIFPQRFH